MVGWQLVFQRPDSRRLRAEHQREKLRLLATARCVKKGTQNVPEYACAEVERAVHVSGNRVLPMTRQGKGTKVG